VLKQQPPRPRPRASAIRSRRGASDPLGPEGTQRLAAQRESTPPRAPRANEIHPGDLVAGRYRVETVRARSRGLTVDALHELLDKRVTLRLLAPHQVEPRAAERLRREARALAAIESEHVARILDVGQLPDGTLFLARERIEGDALIERARAAGGLSLHEALTIFVQVCEAVQEAHARGIVLRGLRPEDLVVTYKKSGEPVAKIVELGVCKVTRGPSGGSSCTASDLSPWASPELVRNTAALDERADIWALGCLLHELLCGARPFRGDGIQLLMAIAHQEVPAITAKRSSLPRSLDTIVRWALAKEPERRPRNVHALVHTLWPLAPLPTRLLIDRIARIASGARHSLGESVLEEPPPASEEEPKTVRCPDPIPISRPRRAAISSMPIIPPLPPVPSMAALDPNDPILREAERRRDRAPRSAGASGRARR
jgi:eukaryotic-like serine/threonine-protein kinase